MRTTAAALKGLGYRTVHIPGDRFFLQGGRGWHTVGFDVVDDVCTRALDPIHTAPEVTDAAIAYVDAQPADEPLFLWVHYFDHHIPFRLTAGLEPFDQGREQVDIYDAELRFADRHWGRLLTHVEQAWSGWQYDLPEQRDPGLNEARAPSVSSLFGTDRWRNGTNRHYEISEVLRGFGYLSAYGPMTQAIH